MNLRVDWCSFEAAEYAVTHWHYSGTMPAGKTAKLGVWEDGRFIGCVIISLGSCQSLVKPYGLKMHEGCELTRVALDRHQTPVTRIVRIALLMFKRRNPGVRLLISYADPNHGHHGGIYQGGNWTYLGLTPPDRIPVVDGKKIHPRTLSDMVKRGQVTRKGVPYVRVPGKHRYAMALDSSLQPLLNNLRKNPPMMVDKNLSGGLESKRAPEVGDGSLQEHSGSSILTQAFQPQAKRSSTARPGASKGGG
jgi:hypothetical protein